MSSMSYFWQNNQNFMYVGYKYKISLAWVLKVRVQLKVILTIKTKNLLYTYQTVNFSFGKSTNDANTTHFNESYADYL